jgi:hypothetical protein
MNPIVIGSLTLVVTFLCAMVGIEIRRVLPPSHLAKDSQDVVRTGMGLVATMTALLLGLVTAAAKSTFDAQDGAVRASAVNLLSLDHLLAGYGPDARQARDALKEVVRSRLELTWPAKGSSSHRPAGFQAGTGGEPVEHAIVNLNPTTDAQRFYKSQALGLTEEVMKTRWGLLSNRQGAIPTAFLAVVICWLGATFASFGLFAPKNATVVVVLFIAAFSVAAAVFLLLELNQPFDGLIKVSGEPLRFALENLGKP